YSGSKICHVAVEEPYTRPRRRAVCHRGACAPSAASRAGQSTGEAVEAAVAVGDVVPARPDREQLVRPKAVTAAAPRRKDRRVSCSSPFMPPLLVCAPRCCPILPQLWTV